MKRRRRKSTARRKFRSRLLACLRRYDGSWITIAKIACDLSPNYRNSRITGTLKQLVAEDKVEERPRLRPRSLRYFRLRRERNDLALLTNSRTSRHPPSASASWGLE